MRLLKLCLHGYNVEIETDFKEIQITKTYLKPEIALRALQKLDGEISQNTTNMVILRNGIFHSFPAETCRSIAKSRANYSLNLCFANSWLSLTTYIFRF